MHGHGWDRRRIVDPNRPSRDAALKLEESVIGADPDPALRIFKLGPDELIG